MADGERCFPGALTEVTLNSGNKAVHFRKDFNMNPSP